MSRGGSRTPSPPQQRRHHSVARWQQDSESATATPTPQRFPKTSIRSSRSRSNDSQQSRNSSSTGGPAIVWAPAGHRTGAQLRHHRLGLASSQWCENRAPPNNAQKYLQPQQRLAVVARQQHPSGESQIVRTRAGPRTGAQLRHSRWVWHPSQRSNKPDTAKQKKKKKTPLPSLSEDGTNGTTPTRGTTSTTRRGPRG